MIRVGMSKALRRAIGHKQAQKKRGFALLLSKPRKDLMSGA
jgi:hypothetical protein